MKDYIFDRIPQTCMTSSKNSIYLYSSTRDEIAVALTDGLEPLLQIYYECVKHITSTSTHEIISHIYKTKGKKGLYDLALAMALGYEKSIWGKEWHLWMTKQIPGYIEKELIKLAKKEDTK